MVYIYNCLTGEAEAGGLSAQSQPELHQVVSQNHTSCLSVITALQRKKQEDPHPLFYFFLCFGIFQVMISL